MAKTFYTLADLNTGDVLPETYLDQNNVNHASLIVPPMAQAASGTPWIVASGTSSTVAFTATYFDTDTMWSAAAPTVLTVQTPGVYLVRANVRWSANNSGIRHISINAGTTAIAASGANAASEFAHDQSISALWSADAGESFSLVAFQNSGSALSLPAQAHWSPILGAAWLGRTTAP